MGSFFLEIRDRLRSSFRPETKPPQTPDGVQIYAVGDVHGERRLLEALLASIADHGRSRSSEGVRTVIVMLGDYIDRGPDSRGVLNLLCGLAATGGGGVEYRFLRGNHEAAMLDFLADPVGGGDWLNYGGAETLASYGLRASSGLADPNRLRALRDAFVERLPEEHRAFLDGLEPMVALGDYVFAHAGVRPGVALDRQRLEDLLWIREPFLSSSRFHGRVVVHGHTPVDVPVTAPNRIGIDTGAYASGILTAVFLYATSVDMIRTT